MLSYFKRWDMAIPLAPKQIVSFEELLMSQVIQQEVLTRLLVEKGIFSKEEFLEMVSVVDRKIKKKREGAYIFLFQRDKDMERASYEKRST
jgi:uncharacterized protein YqgQ